MRQVAALSWVGQGSGTTVVSIKGSLQVTLADAAGTLLASDTMWCHRNALPNCLTVGYFLAYSAFRI